MYKKKANTSQDNTGNSKKRKLKYELYDTNKTEDDYSMTMDGGANSNPFETINLLNRPTSEQMVEGQNAPSVNPSAPTLNIPLQRLTPPPVLRRLPPPPNRSAPPTSSDEPSAPPPPSVEPYTPPPTVITSKEELNKKVIFYDEQDEIDKFINNWFADPPNFKKVNGFNVIDMTATISKFKTEFADTSSNYDKLLGGLLNKFTNYTSQNIAEIQNSNIFTNDYISTILTQLNNEKDNTVAVFEYDLYLYNLDTILETYKNSVYDKFTKFFNATYFKKHIENAKNLFGVNAIIETIDKDQGQQIKMYIPKLLKTSKSLIDELKGGSNLNPQTTYEPYNITKLKKLENKNSKEITRANKKIRTKFVSYDELWDTVLNDKKLHYGFEGETPKNLIKNNNGSGKEFTLSNDNHKAIIERYFKKCNDLQQLYINKHIELLAIFKKMNEYINLNNTINDIIKKLVDP